MKTILFSVLLSLLVFDMSCTRNADDSNPADVAVSGTWRVTLFSERGNDETGDFAGYNFLFNTDGTLTAVKSGSTKNGTWSTGSGRFNINLGPKTDSNKPLGELTDDWQILSVSITEIRLTDDNASSNEFLTFTKN